MPVHAEARGLRVQSLFDPLVNLDVGANYFARLLDRNRGAGLDLALASWNWGPANVERGGSWPEETTEFIARVKQYHQHYRRTLTP
jgi:soluble lytic murein transglycosylase-like protein